jgi:protein SCO1/2
MSRANPARDPAPPPAMPRRRWLALLGLLPLAGAAIPVLEFLDRRRRPGTQRPVGGFHRGYFPNPVLRTHDDERVRLYDDLLRGKTVLIHFFYTDCRDVPCGVATTNLVQLQRLLGERCGRDVFMYSFTLAPDQDTPARLRDYRDTHKVGPGWTFLTGRSSDLELCRVRFGFTDPDPGLDREKGQHANVLLLGNEPHERWLASPAAARPRFLLSQLDRVAGVKV